MKVVWSVRALEDWRRLGYDDAKAIATAVERWAATGLGTIIHVEGEYRLLVGGHTVVLLIDGDTLHVDGVRRS
jgi:hypothetical protein